MHFQLDEVAPLAPALIPLGELLFWAGCAIFIVLVILIVKALFGIAGGTLGKLPFVGGWVNGSLHSLEHKIVGVMATGLASVDARMGTALHALARMVDWVGREIARHANLIETLATLIVGRAAVSLVLVFAHRLRSLIHAAEATAQHAFHRLQVIERGLARGIGHDVLPRIRSLERGFARTIEHDIASLRARDRVLAREYERLYKWTRTHALAAGTLAFAGAVAVALSRLGMGWMRCPSFLRLGRRLGCGGFGALEEILFATGEALIVTDLCAFAAAAETVAHELTPVLLELVDVENALVGCHGATTPPLLTVRAPGAPPVRNPLPLAA